MISDAVEFERPERGHSADNNGDSGRRASIENRAHFNETLSDGSSDTSSTTTGSSYSSQETLSTVHEKMSFGQGIPGVGMNRRREEPQKDTNETQLQEQLRQMQQQILQQKLQQDYLQQQVQRQEAEIKRQKQYIQQQHQQGTLPVRGHFPSPVRAANSELGPQRYENERRVLNSNPQEQRARKEEKMQQLIQLQQMKTQQKNLHPDQHFPPQRTEQDWQEEQRQRRARERVRIARLQTQSRASQLSDSESHMTESSLARSMPSVRPLLAVAPPPDRTDGLSRSQPLALSAESLLPPSSSSDMRSPRAIIDELSSETDRSSAQIIVRHLPASYFEPGTPESQRPNRKSVTQFRRSGSMVYLGSNRRSSMRQLESLDSGIDNTAFTISTNTSRERKSPVHVILNMPPEPKKRSCLIPSLRAILMTVVIVLLVGIAVSIILAFTFNI